jgi:CheY-like chemotaxis protein
LTGEEQQEFIEIIHKSGARMLSTVNNIVDFSKIESGIMKVDIKKTNINEQIEFVYKFFTPEAKHKGVSFSFKTSLPSKEAIIKTDPEKIYAILTNLVKNSIKFCDKGSLDFGYENKGKYLEFYVKDSGIGIPKDRQKAIFERFAQADISDKSALQGAGLGLAISKSYVEMLGGEIWVESEEGIGSTFYFTIPYNPELEEINTIENVVSANYEETQIKNLKILVVEDDETSYKFLGKILQKDFIEILYTRTGVEAVDACKYNPDIDLILMDIRIPVLDGYEATRQIRQFNKDVIIIAQTAYAFAGDSEKALEAGCNDYITKPIMKTLLFDLIKKYCNK